MALTSVQRQVTRVRPRVYLAPTGPKAVGKNLPDSVKNRAPSTRRQLDPLQSKTVDRTPFLGRQNLTSQ